VHLLLLQRVGWVSTILSYFGVGVPLGVLLSFRYHLGPRGLCIGLAAGCYCYMLSTMAIVLTTDWDL
jgi:MATE family multidrug resistance protein